MHENELPLRYLITTLEGETNELNFIQDQLKKHEKNCIYLPLGEFAVIPSNIPVLSKKVENNLKIDQNYFYHISQANSNGT